MTDPAYEYEDDGKYCYPETKILRNKLGITNANVFSDIERSIYPSARPGKRIQT